jgi:tRNA pseudouridine55 synthase
MDGILLIDKPAGWTSFDVVAKVRGQIKRETGLKKPKVGHTGTLDPLATGLMVVVCGSYCKRASEFSKLDKVYEVTMILGQTSTTGDDEGEKTVVSEAEPSQEAIVAALEGFVGDSMQKPPIYSAIKINGQRAYKLAREGKAPEMEARPVTIYSITEIAYAYPEVKFTTKVGSGTYIRSLVEDIGTNLGTGAYMSALRRTEVGKFSISDALVPENVPLEAIRQEN